MTYPAVAAQKIYTESPPLLYARQSNLTTHIIIKIKQDAPISWRLKKGGLRSSPFLLGKAYCFGQALTGTIKEVFNTFLNLPTFLENLVKARDDVSVA